MNDKINSIDDIRSWEDIEKCIRYINRPIDDFIILNKIDNQYILMSQEEIENIDDKTKYECFILPNCCLRNIEYYTSYFAFTGFNSLPRYSIVNDLYDNINNDNIYKLLWFTGAVYEIWKNKYYNSYFSKCINYDKNFIDDVFERFLEICDAEIENKLDFNYKYIFSGARKYFLPISNLDCKYIKQNIDISNINNIIDYISLVIELSKAEYKFLVVYY